jgi:hypothetical protein
MTNNATSEVAAIGVRLLDDAYLAWFSAETECELALHAWFQGTDADLGVDYSVYRLALEREEAAARDLERAWRFDESRNGRVIERSESVVR